MTDRIYLDSNIIIYYVEGNSDLHEAVGSVLRAYLVKGAAFHTSEITVGECLIGIGRKSRRQQSDYLAELENPAFISLAPISGNIIRRAAILGAGLNMKLVDAIHVATAEALACSVFLTNDRGIRAPAGIELRYLVP